jgi:DNA replication protein DnaC
MSNHPVIRNAEELQAYKKYVIGMAEERYEKLCFGKPLKNPSLYKLPQSTWTHPANAARSGAKLMLSGPSGTGKSSLLKRIAWLLCLDRLHPRGGFIPLVLDKIRDHGGHDGYFDWLMGGDVLLLDDIDKMRGTIFECQKILTALDHYDQNDYAVIVTMNGSFGELEKKLVANGIPMDYILAIISRIKRKAQFELVTGPDFRDTSNLATEGN